MELKLKKLIKNILLKQLEFYNKLKSYSFFFFVNIKIHPKNKEIDKV